tara:strand:- start:848 stop:1282 length:435 start_codon:yes stop_codon:yes gene_type:complete
MHDPEYQLREAVIALKSLPHTQLIAQSTWIWSKPVGDVIQADFLNGVVAIQTSLQPLELLDALQAIEHQQGRVRTVHWGPRTLDLDLLLYGQESINNSRLIVPHPHIKDRLFVLEPLAEIDPDLCLADQKTISQLIEKLKQDLK